MLSHDSCGDVVCIKADCFPAFFLVKSAIPSFPTAWSWCFPGVVLRGIIISEPVFGVGSLGYFFLSLFDLIFTEKALRCFCQALPKAFLQLILVHSVSFLNVHRNLLGTFIHLDFDSTKQHPQPQDQRWWSPALQSSSFSMRKPLLYPPGSFMYLMAFAGERSERTFGNHIKSVEQISLKCDPFRNLHVSHCGRE